MDRTLPFSFLDHKIKCSNSGRRVAGHLLPLSVMAWKNREGGDKSHTNGVHCEKKPAQALKAFVKDELA